ncbi:MAG: hypothetical protein ABR552_05855, partial [Actinomycetota bacterium]
MTVAAATLLVSAGGAGAVAVPKPAGQATATALDISLHVPGSAELLDNLSAAGLPTDALKSALADKAGVVPQIDLKLKISDTLSSVSEGVSNAWAQSVNGSLTIGDPASPITKLDLLTQPAAEAAACSATACNDAANDVTQGPIVRDVTVPAVPGVLNEAVKLGTIEILGAHAQTPSNAAAHASTALVKIDFTLDSLLKALPAVKEQVDKLQGTLNDVIDTLNSTAIVPLETELAGTPLGEKLNEMNITFD